MFSACDKDEEYEVVKTNFEELGKLVVFSKNEGERYRVLFGDRSEFDKECGGLITLCTANRQFIADFSCVKIDQESNSACSGDPDCDFICKFIGVGTNVTCFVSISTACGIWCI